MDIYKFLAFTSPFISAFIASFLTYRFGLKSKKFDILYQNKLPAFKEMTAALVEFKKFCSGRIAYLIGSEYPPHYEENFGALMHRTSVANAFDTNSVFLCSKSRKEIESLISEMSSLTNAEAAIASTNENLPELKNEYQRLLTIADNIIDILYKDLHLNE